MRKDDKDREIADLKPKARSALAARWEESVKSRGNGKGRSSSVHSATVLSGTSDVSMWVWLGVWVWFLRDKDTLGLAI